MRNRSTPILLGILAAAASILHAQQNSEQVSAERARANFARPIVLGPDDVRVIPDAPKDYNAQRTDIPHGRVEPFEAGSHVVRLADDENVERVSIALTDQGRRSEYRGAEESEIGREA